ncbi:MAG: 3-phosphoserine/phosphohydroxythreonine transaminase [Flavobacteriales bacterium]|nr:3-phosphoserine/phosphohydroxythreonine transaminase [Flavobacteriales bacterium]
MSKIHNFSAGPAVLPQVAIDAAAKAIHNFANTGLSILEVSHRGKEYVAVMDEARSLVKKLLNLGDEYEVLYLQGGASLQFLMVAYNLLNKKGGYIDTGTWASNAIKEAKLLGEVDVLASSKDKNYTYIPKNFTVPSDIDYLHFTSNNTIYGSQFHDFPKTDSLLVCDMSSDMFSRKIDASKFDLIYAGAQKNLGPAGATLVVIKKEILGKVSRQIPSMLSYQVHIDKESMFNTPPAFAVYVVLQTLKWIEQLGIDTIENRNRQKAELLYNEVDRNPNFVGPVAKDDRSFMNPVFLLADESKTDAFMAACKEANISGIKGHRSVGGFRASMYNALELDSVQALVNVMQTFN